MFIPIPVEEFIGIAGGFLEAVLVQPGSSRLRGLLLRGTRNTVIESAQIGGSELRRNAIQNLRRRVGNSRRIDNGQHLLSQNHVLRILQHHQLILLNRGGSRVEVNHLHGVIQQCLDGQRAATIREGHELGGNASVLLFQTRDAVGALGKLRGGAELQIRAAGGEVFKASQTVFLGGLRGDDERVLILRLGCVEGADFSPGATRGEGTEGGG